MIGGVPIAMIRPMIEMITIISTSVNPSFLTTDLIAVSLFYSPFVIFAKGVPIGGVFSSPCNAIK